MHIYDRRVIIPLDALPISEDLLPASSQLFHVQLKTAFLFKDECPRAKSPSLSALVRSVELTLSVEDSSCEQADKQAGGRHAQPQQQPALPPAPAWTAAGTAAVEESHLQKQTPQLSG